MPVTAWCGMSLRDSSRQPGGRPRPWSRPGEAVEVSPLAANAWQTLALMLYYAREYPEALSRAADALALNPNYPATLIVQARTLVELQRYDEALATLQRLRELADGPAAMAEVGRVLALSGRRQEAEHILDELPAAIGPDGVVQSEDPRSS